MAGKCEVGFFKRCRAAAVHPAKVGAGVVRMDVVGEIHGQLGFPVLSQCRPGEAACSTQSRQIRLMQSPIHLLCNDGVVRVVSQDALGKTPRHHAAERRKRDCHHVIFDRDRSSDSDHTLGDWIFMALESAFRSLRKLRDGSHSFSTFKAKLGKDPPLTMHSMSNLACNYLNQDRPGEAVSPMRRRVEAQIGGAWRRASSESRRRYGVD